MSGWWWVGAVYGWAWMTFALLSASHAKSHQQRIVMALLSLLWPLAILTPSRWRREPAD